MDELEKIKRKKLNEMIEKSQTKVFEASGSDFQRKVIERSNKIPIVVDFWAP